MGCHLKLCVRVNILGRLEGDKIVRCVDIGEEHLGRGSSKHKHPEAGGCLEF